MTANHCKLSAQNILYDTVLAWMIVIACYLCTLAQETLLLQQMLQAFIF